MLRSARGFPVIFPMDLFVLYAIYTFSFFLVPLFHQGKIGRFMLHLFTILITFICQRQILTK